MAAVPNPALANFEGSDRKLARVLSRSQLLLLSLGAIIGSGWLFAALGAAAGTGPSSVLSWIIGGVLVLFIAMAYAEISVMLPRSGAVVRYPQLSHGGFAGFILGWAYLLASASVPAIEAIATVQYLAPHLPVGLHLLVNHQSTASIITFPQGWIFTVILLVIFFFINVAGARFLGRFNNAIMVWKLIIPVLTFVLLFALSFHGNNFSPPGGFTPDGAKAVFVVIPGAGIVFSYLGFRQGLDYGGEARNPQRDIPFATIGAVIIGTIIYTLLQLAFNGGLNWAHLGLKTGDYAGLANVNTATSSPFYAVLKASGVGLLGGFAALLLADAVVSPAGTGYIYLGTGGRTIYGLGVGGYLPGAAAVSKRRVPWVALIASLVVAIIFAAPSKSWYGLVGFITAATVFTYIMGGTCLQVFRRTAPDLARPYRLGAAGFWGPVSFLAAAVIIFWSGFTVLVQLDAAVFIALPLYVWFFAVQRGYLPRAVAYPLGAVYLVAWVLLEHWGHWVLSSAPATTPSRHAPFVLWFILTAVAVYGFAAICAVAGTPQGRRMIMSAWWLLTLVFGLTLLVYYSSFGVVAKPVKLLTFPYDTIWALLFSLACYYWSVASGFVTDEMAAILATGSGLVPEEVPAPV